MPDAQFAGRHALRNLPHRGACPIVELSLLDLSRVHGNGFTAMSYENGLIRFGRRSLHVVDVCLQRRPITDHFRQPGLGNVAVVENQLLQRR